MRHPAEGLQCLILVIQGLFEVLPEKLKERRSSLNATPSASRKRPPPVVTEGFSTQDRQAAQSSSTPSSLKEAAATPSRTRTHPSDFLAKLAKRNSMPDPHLLTGLSEGAAAQMQSQQMFGYQSPSTASPMSGHFDFTPQLGNAQIPDLKNVMFPSDNPFAYPNQSISTLESGDASYSFPDPNLGYNDHSMSGTPTGGSTHMSIPTPHYDNGFSFQHALSENPASAQAFAAHGRHFGAPITDLLMQNAIGGEHMNLSGLPHFHDPLTTAGNDVPGSSRHDEFWKGSTGTNPVPPPGLEDYFNNERLAWDSSWGDHRYHMNT